MSYIIERLCRIRSALEFLDRTNQFQAMKDQAEMFYNLKECLVYNFNIMIDLGVVYDHDAALGDSILLTPLESTSLFQEIVFQFCQSHQLLSLETTPSQICARLRIVSFPCGCDSLHISSMSNLNKCINYPGFVLVTGVVVGISSSAKYTQSTKYVCPEKDCEGNIGNHFIRMHVPGASENQTIRNDFRCCFCGDVLVEVTSSRTLSDKILMDVIPISLTGPSQKEMFKPGRIQSIPVFVKDELVDVVTLGDACQVVGITRADVNGETIDVSLEANNISQLTKGTGRPGVKLPDAVRTLYEANKHSPWSFPLNMAYHFGDQIVPCGALIKLRLLLLISLVLDPKKQLLHILAIGRETSVVMSLYQQALKFSQRSFPAMVGTPLCGKVTNDCCHRWAPYFIHAGALPLCSGGVCVCGDLGLWKKQNKEQLQAILSGGKIFLDLTSKLAGGLPQQQTLNLQCHVWGAFSPLTAGSKVTAHKDDVMCGSSTGDLSKSFLDFICFLDGGDSFTEEEIQNQACYLSLISWCVDEAGKPSVDIQHNDMDMYVTIARQLEPCMTSAAETLIQSYYTATRVARSSGLGGSDVSVSGMATLLSLATGFAKLRLSGEVQETDAVMAVYLYEESLVSRLGLSVLSVQPQPHISESRISEFLGEQNDAAMQRFQVQLLKFCSRAFDSRLLWKEE